MSVDHLDKLKQLKAEYEADQAEVEAELAQLEQKRDWLEHKRRELRQLIEGVNGVLSSIRSDNEPPRAVSLATNGSETPTSARESIPTTNGLPENANRRQKVLHIVPSFHGKPFKAGDIRQKFVAVYLGGVEPPNFPQAINNLLKRMAEKGEIKSLGRDESQHGAPYIYQENRNQEETLNLGP